MGSASTLRQESSPGILLAIAIVYLVVFVSVFHRGFLCRLQQVENWLLVPVVLLIIQSIVLLCSSMLHRRLAMLSIFSVLLALCNRRYS